MFKKQEEHDDDNPQTLSQEDLVYWENRRNVDNDDVF